MNITLIGASGFIGTAIRNEALARGHHVKALVRKPEQVPAQAKLQVERADVFDSAALARQLAGSDAVISAFSGHSHGDIHADYVRGIESIVAATKDAKVPRLLVVGGAGSLYAAPGLQVVDAPDFPEQWKASALGARDALELLRQSKGLDWSMLSPAAVIAPGERTGKFRLGRDDLLVDASGQSRISLQDYAVAMIDELEKAAHRGQRFTLAY
ncbi:NAD(P)-dependent oxidoreductase [Ramlibacter sp. G-1-2-2]|uniref:NAD(P)-dependent oxidoreductase n=1 Tax=Ramlibacter agri TaxID=2728837 RepID=A0A848HBY3_9BURK|nr:NAD(P)-dependent oxidoreductase [Ramlibacter agri]NML47592.1 NAD(P)-dependent oxidoreductase [Ramlibacter agri]